MNAEGAEGRGGRGRVRRAARRAVRCLVLGAVLNVGVAFGLSILYSIRHPVSRWMLIGWPQTNLGLGDPPMPNWPFPPQDTWDRQPSRENYVDDQRSWYREAYAMGSVDGQPGLMCEQAAFQIGFPFRCLSLQREREIPASAPRDRLLSASMNGLRTGVVLHGVVGSRRPLIIPVWPRPGAFIAGVACYGLAVAAATGAMRSVKRGRRSRRTQCTECAYQLDSLRICPECGSRASTPRGHEDGSVIIPGPSTSP
jgi:hypothetical protein